MKHVKCSSGINGWQCRLQSNYRDFEEFRAYSEMHGLHERLGYKTVRGAWRANPIVQGSVIPSDFQKVKEIK